MHAVCGDNSSRRSFFMKYDTYKKYILAGVSILILGIVLVVLWKSEMSNQTYLRNENSKILLPIENKIDQKTSLENAETSSVSIGDVQTQSTCSKSNEDLTTDYITFSIDDKNVEVPFREGDTLYTTLRTAKEKGLVQFEGRDYSGLGFFVTAIGSLRGGDGKYIMYFINNKEATVGVSQYVPDNNDVIEWKLK